jgi:hypothetical protein
MSRFVSLSVAGLLLGAAVPLLVVPAVAQSEPVGEQVYASCEHRFAVIYPGQPKTRDLTYTTTAGRAVPAREYLFREGADRFAVTVAVFPANSPVVDDAVVEHAAEQIRTKGGRINQQFSAPYDPGMPGRQLNISYPNGKQLRASVYMANRHLTITEALADQGDFGALQFEQSIALTDEKGNDLDPPNGTDVRNFGCSR